MRCCHSLSTIMKWTELLFWQHKWILLVAILNYYRGRPRQWTPVLDIAARRTCFLAWSGFSFSLSLRFLTCISLAAVLESVWVSFCQELAVFLCSWTRKDKNVSFFITVFIHRNACCAKNGGAAHDWGSVVYMSESVSCSGTYDSPLCVVLWGCIFVKSSSCPSTWIRKKRSYCEQRETFYNHRDTSRWWRIP